jgi:hypothetical protein
MKRTLRTFAIIAVATSLGGCLAWRGLRPEGREQRHGEERGHGDDRRERDGEHREGGDRQH